MVGAEEGEAEQEGANTDPHQDGDGLEALRRYLDQGVPLVEENEEGHTPLDLAAQGGHLDKVEFLVQVAGVPCDSGYAVQLASAGGHLGVVEYLAGCGAPLDRPDRDGELPSTLAAWKGHTDVVAFLCDPTRGAVAPDQTTSDGDTPLDNALIAGHIGVARLLVENFGVPCDLPHKQGFRPIHWACEYGQLAAVEYLAGRGAQLDGPNDEGDHPIHLAASSGSTEVVEFLCDPAKGAIPPEQRSRAGNTPLNEAVMYGRLKVVELLAGRFGALCDVPVSEGNYPTHYACWDGELAIAEYLAGRGAPLNVPNDLGEHPIHLAARGGHTEVVEWLCEERVQPRLCTFDN